MEIIHKEKSGRIFIKEEGYKAKLKYKKNENILEVYKTEVPEQLRGKGIGYKLMESLLSYAREYQYKVKPLCSFAQKYMERHPQYAELKVG